MTESPFTYRNCQFVLKVEQRSGETFLPTVEYQSGIAGPGPVALPVDTEAYATQAEALRHAEQQATRWVHDRTGDGQGQF